MRRGAWSPIGMAAVVLAVGASRPARADDTPNPTPLNKEEARKRYEEGMADVHRHDFEAARIRFLQARALDPNSPWLVWDLAVAEAQTHHHGVEALRDFHTYLLSHEATDADRSAAAPFIQMAWQDTGHIAVVAADDAVVRVDGEPVPNALAAPIDVEPGPHRVEARRGDQIKVVSVSPRAGETVRADLRLDASSGDIAPKAGLDGGAQRSSASLLPVNPPDADTGRDSSTARIVVTTAFGVAAVGTLIGAIAELGHAHHEHDAAARDQSGLGPNGCSADPNSGPCVQGYAALSSEAVAKNWSTGLFVAGGALAGGAVASWFLLAPKHHDAGQLAVTTTVAPGFASLTLNGHF